MDILSQILQNLLSGDGERVSEFTCRAIDQGISPVQILNAGLLAGMAIIGERFKVHEIFLPDVLFAAQAMTMGMNQLKPLLSQDGIPPIGKVVMGSVQGDLHDIGKNLVGIMLKGAGFEVIDIGNDVSSEKFINEAVDQNASVIGMSALLTTTMPMMRKVVELINKRQLNKKIKTIVGGAPVSKEFAHEIGADAYGFDAANAVDQVKMLVGK